jgi:hypothetical protein
LASDLVRRSRLARPRALSICNAPANSFFHPRVGGIKKTGKKSVFIKLEKYFFQFTSRCFIKPVCPIFSVL